MVQVEMMFTIMLFVIVKNLMFSTNAGTTEYPHAND